MKIFFTGFMAVGKSAVGAALAARRQGGFVDLDAAIAARAGTAVAEIIRDQGEARFRELERQELAAQIAGPAEVIATGGGTAVDPRNMAAMRAAGLVIELTCPLEVSLARAEAEGGAAPRPLLGDAASAAERLASRRSAYRQAHATVATHRRPIADVAARVDQLAALAETLGPALETSTICALEASPYPITVAPGQLDQLGDAVATFARRPPTRVAVVSDTNVAAHYLDRAIASLEAAGLATCRAIIAPGEASKTPAEHARLAGELIGAGLDRRSLIVALGGGVVGDLAGYVAATLMRGVDLFQVPTSLVAMVDSAIGGKTGVNLDAGKNLLGAFWQPRAVLVDPELLSTLPERERRAGLGELFKYGLLDSAELFGQVASAPETTIGRAAAYKSWIVTRDEREETGERALLNLGHTVGHAIERAAGYGEVLHGEAVALGLIAAARVSRAVAGAGDALESQITSALERAGLDTDLDRWLAPEVLAHIGVDKKRTGDRVGFIALSAMGRPQVVSLTTAELAKILEPA